MQNKQEQQDENFLPSHLLDDDDEVPTTSSLNNIRSQGKEFAFSAPPILFNLGFRIEQDFFDEVKKTWETCQLNSARFDIHEKTCEFTQYQIQANSTRKLSLQNEEEYSSYESYQPISMPHLEYFPVYSLQEEILGNLPYIVEWCKDQYGSRNLQNALDSCDGFLKEKLFQHLLHRIPELIYDKFGNYVVQKFLDIGSESQKECIYVSTKKQFIFVCLHSYGCRVIQKIIEWSSQNTTIQLQISKLMSSHLLQIITNQNGNHIVQRMVELFNRQSTQHIANIILQHIEKLGFHSFGCRVIQKYLECGKNQEKRIKMLEILLQISLRLCKCQYGNYIMQYIVTTCKEFQPKIIKIFQDNFVDLSCNKFASNVIQKAIKSLKKTFTDRIILKLLGNNELIIIAKNQFGNYVIQSLLEGCSTDKRSQLKVKLKQISSQICKSQYGRHVLLQLEKFK